MKKVSFTENYYKCVSGLPIVQVAAYKLLQEGLLGTALKLGALGAGAYGLYNLDPTAVSNFFGNNDPNSTMSKIGNTLGRGLQGYQHTVQDVGNNLFGSEGKPVLGGEEYTRRHAFETNMERALNNVDANTASQVDQLTKQYDTGNISQEEYQSRLRSVYDSANERKGELYNRETTNTGYSPKFFGPGYGYDNQNNSIYQAKQQAEISAANNQTAVNMQNQMKNEGTTPPSNPPEFANDPRHMTPGDRESYRAAQNVFAGDSRHMTPTEREDYRAAQNAFAGDSRHMTSADRESYRAAQNAFAGDSRHLTPEQKQDYRDNQTAVNMQNQMKNEGTAPPSNSSTATNAPTNNSSPKNEYWSPNYEKKVDEHIQQNSSLNQLPNTTTSQGSGIQVAKNAAIGAVTNSAIRVGANVVSHKLTHPTSSPSHQSTPQLPQPTQSQQPVTPNQTQTPSPHTGNKVK